MVCACSLLFHGTYFAITLGYPLKTLYYLDRNGKKDKKWIYYFFILTLFYLLELTLLYPLKYLLNKICFCMFPTVKSLFALWLYYPKVEGINLIESKVGSHLDMAFLKVNPMVGGFLEKLGIEDKGPSSSASRKIQ